MNKRTLTARLMLISSMLIFGSVGIFRRMIPLSSAALAGFRGIAGASFLLVIMLVSKKSLRQHTGPARLLGLILTGAGIGINWMLLFEAYDHTTVAAATLCYYMEPTIVILLSPLIFREKLTPKKFLCVIAALTGMLLVTGLPGGASEAGETSIKGALFGLGAAMFFAFVVIMNKKLADIDPYFKTMVELASAAAVLLPYILITDDISSFHPDHTVVIMLLIIGFIHTGTAYTMYFASIDKLPVQTVAITGYLDPVTAMILSVIILGEPLTPGEIAGSILILGAAAVCELTIKPRHSRHHT